MARRRWDKDKGEITEPEPVPTEIEQPIEPKADETEKADEPEAGPLSKLQAAMRDVLDFDQIGEIRLALYSREAELEKHAKKGSDLGVREEDARRRLHVICGDSLRFGLTRIFAPEEVTEQRDVFFDREQPNGRSVGEAPDGNGDITFRTVDGQSITTHVSILHEHLADLAALHRAGMMSSQLRNAIQSEAAGDIWELMLDEVEPEGGPEGAGQEAEEGRELAATSGISA